MNTSKLTATLLFALCLTNSQAAVHLSSDKTGSAIIVPFYTVSNQMNTLLSLNNTTDDNKAIKIHIKEAKSGDLLASFNVYLTAQDMWTMGMGQVPSIDGGRIRMVSNDQSCTIGFPNNEDIPVDEDWLWEHGTIEIIEMGTVGDIEAWQTMENDCEAIVGYWNDSQMWANNSEDQLSAATGGLHAEVTLMDVEQGHSANIPIIHMNGFYGEDNIQHTAAGDETPDLSTGTKDSLVIVDGQAINTTWPTGYEAVSALLMKSTLTNEFNIEPEVAARTEWIISLPTLIYHKNNTQSKLPFDFKFSDIFWFPHSLGNTVYFDREGVGQPSTCGLCDPVPPYEVVNHAVNNFWFLSNRYHENPYPTLSSELSSNLKRFKVDLYTDPQTLSGKVNLNLIQGNGANQENNRGRDSSNPNNMHAFYGLPVVGFSYTKFANANAQPGLLAQYAFVRKHFGEKKVVIGDAQ